LTALKPRAACILLCACGLAVLTAPLAAQPRGRPPVRGAAPQQQQSQSADPAPPPLTDSLMGQAKLDYEAGRILFNDEDYSGALVKFQRAFEQAGDLRLLWNMAVCEKNLRHYAAVLRLLERYRREGEATMTQLQRAEVNEVLQTVQMLVSSARITVSENGATVSIDDRPVGQTPLAEPILVDLGQHRITVAKPGFRTEHVTQDFTGGSEVNVDLTLLPDVAASRLTVTTDADATISINGNPVGEGMWSGSLPAGEHAIRVAAVGMHPYEAGIALQPGQARSLNITLRPEESGGGVPAWVWVGVGVVAAGGIATGAFFLFRDPAGESMPVTGTLGPAVRLP
jgi:hypothetical protein